MLTLPNGCRCSEPTIFPRNWNKPDARLNIDWYIQYYFYEADQKKGRLTIVKGGINTLKNRIERKAAATDLVIEIKKLLKEGYNPITRLIADKTNDTEITEFSRLPEALNFAFGELDVAKATKDCVETSLNRFNKIIIELNLQYLQLHELKTKHVRKILTKCAQDYNLSASSFNHYKAYFSMLLKILLREDAIEYNPALNIEKQKGVKKLKRLLTLSERQKINNHFKETDIYFYRFMHCFFHSGARPIELLEIKRKDVDLKNLTYKIIVKKGKLFEEQLRPIKEVAVDYWQAQLNECNETDFVFGSCLHPGDKKGKRDYITKKWHREVKIKLQIDVDLYSLKHLNLDETAAILDAEAASKMAGHTSKFITLKHYLVGEKQRQNERLKKVNNTFS